MNSPLESDVFSRERDFLYEWRLLNALTGTESRAVRLESRWAVVSSSGEEIATTAGDELIVVDDAGPRTLKFPKPSARESLAEDLLFSADGTHLWATIYNEQEQPVVALLDATTLAVLDTVPMPMDSDNAHSEGLTFWLEPQMALHPASGWVSHHP